MERMIKASMAIPAERLRDRGGHEWWVVDQVPGQLADGTQGYLLRVQDEQGRRQDFPMQAEFERLDA